ncbi:MULTISPECIES: helix-turn-helix domain-containing protein [unclassified Pseudomonas]|uniref:helix-turn-helix transcriptional regulator n=1 Tax=unclassified Pseudomonas TaxID=196821 RepID=UPI000BE2B656|nr:MULTISPECIES: helix-turn-helix domain-containing protein [unclassified Pseudomonas]
MGRAKPDNIQNAAGVFDALTPKEQEVLNWCCQGKTAADIAMLMHCSVSTINFHTHNLHVKFGLNSTTHIAVIVASLGLVTITIPAHLRSVTESFDHDNPHPSCRRPPCFTRWGLGNSQ